MKNNLNKNELRKEIRDTLHVKNTQIKFCFDTQDSVYFYVYMGLVRVTVICSENGTKYCQPEFRVRYLRETPYGYGGAWESEIVTAHNSSEAIEIVKNSKKSQWEIICPCSKFSAVEWEK